MSPAQPSFGDRLAAAFDASGQLCVGIDPHPFLLADWGLGDDASGLTQFGLRVVEAAVGHAAIIKPQVSFFERHGSGGYGALEQVLAAAREAGLIVIADVKRGDIGTSVEAYGQAWLTPGSPLEADAITVSAYQGLGSLEAPLQLAQSAGKGVFVLAATSNPEARALQSAVISEGSRSGTTVAAGIVADVSEWNSAKARNNRKGADEAPRMGGVGVVIGATVSVADYGITEEQLVGGCPTPVLAPGFGHQGARLADVGTLYGSVAPFTIVAASRSILSGGPAELRSTIAEHAREVRSWRG